MIHLAADTGPVNVRPHQYPHFQKQEVEHLVFEMLSTSLVRHSTSAFSSLFFWSKNRMVVGDFGLTIGPLIN